MSVESPSSSRSSCCRATPSLTNSSASDAASMSIRDVVTSIESGELDLNDTTAMDSTPFCRVCLDDNYRTSKCDQVKNITSFSRT